jgi:hypothetical protein
MTDLYAAAKAVAEDYPETRTCVGCGHRVAHGRAWIGANA